MLVDFNIYVLINNFVWFMRAQTYYFLSWYILPNSKWNYKFIVQTYYKKEVGFEFDWIDQLNWTIQVASISMTCIGEFRILMVTC